jgi:hypothetical protein
MEVAEDEVAMDILLPMGLLVALFLGFEFLLWRSTWRGSARHEPALAESPAGARGEIDFQAADQPLADDWDPAALPFVRHRLDVLAEELERLDRDHSVFARAFRYQVARSAYQALIADASRLAEVARLAEAGRLAHAEGSGTTIEVVIPGSLAPVREELDV